MIDQHTRGLISIKKATTTNNTNNKATVVKFDYNEYKQQLYNLSLQDDNPQKRGYEFEKFLNKLFFDFGLSPRNSYKIEGEQIDGSFLFNNDTYLLEAKWTNKPIDKNDLVIFDSKVSSKSNYTRGLFISFSGFTDEALNTLNNGRSVRIILMTVEEIMILLERKQNIKNILENKIRAFAEEGSFYHKIF